MSGEASGFFEGRPDPGQPAGDEGAGPNSRPGRDLAGRDLPAAAIEPHVFLDAVKPLLESRDTHALDRALRDLGSAQRIVPLLDCADNDVRKVAALALALVGDDSCLGPLAAQLRHDDPVVNQMAEHALWSIWFRGGGDEANRMIAAGAEAMAGKDLAQAEGHFTDALLVCPDFAEAYNQRAIVRYLREHFDGSLADCRAAVRLVPDHFGAWSGMGHCLAHQGDFPEALRCYEQALRINPHLDCVRELCQELAHCAAAEDSDEPGDVT